MSGRALEAVCRHFGTSKSPLAAGLKELLDRGIIDQRLYQWGEELRTHRNLAAHATDATFSSADAKDLFDFAIAICEYLFVLQQRFDEFMSRKQRLRSTSGSA